MAFINPRQGLSAHLEGVMNGIFLVATGIIWQELKLTPRLAKLLFGLVLFGTFANWIFTLLGAVWGTSRMTPIAGAGYHGTGLQEALVATGLLSVGVTMTLSLCILIYGLRGKCMPLN